MADKLLLVIAVAVLITLEALAAVAYSIDLAELENSRRDSYRLRCFCRVAELHICQV